MSARTRQSVLRKPKLGLAAQKEAVKGHSDVKVVKVEANQAPPAFSTTNPMMSSRAVTGRALSARHLDPVAAQQDKWLKVQELVTLHEDITEENAKKLEEAGKEAQINHLDLDEFIADIVRTPMKEELDYTDLSDRLAERATVYGVSYIIMPSSEYKRLWNGSILCFVLYNAIFLPAEVGFEWDRGDAAGLFDVVLDVCFLIDLALNFISAFEDDSGKIVSDIALIRQNYMSSWFWIDFTASVPFDKIIFLFASDVGSSDAIKYLALFKCSRLLRLGRVLRFLDKFQFANVWRIVRLLVGFSLLAHWTGCAWHFMLISSDGYWLENVGLTDESSTMKRYYRSSYAALCMLLGENMEPSGNTEIVMAGCILLFGAVIQATLFGQVALLISNQNSIHHLYRLELDSAKESMSALDLPEQLQERVRNYYEYSWHRHRNASFDVFKQQVSHSLRKEITLYLHADLIRRVPFFANVEPHFLVSLVSELRTAICLPGDYVCVEGQLGREMYFIKAGICDVVAAGHHISTLGKGDGFGESALYFETNFWDASLRGVTYCDLVTLSKLDFDRIVRAFPRRAAWVNLWRERRRNRGKKFKAQHRDFNKELDGPYAKETLEYEEKMLQEGALGDVVKAMEEQFNLLNQQLDRLNADQNKMQRRMTRLQGHEGDALRVLGDHDGGSASLSSGRMSARARNKAAPPKVSKERHATNAWTASSALETVTEAPPAAATHTLTAVEPSRASDEFKLPSSASKRKNRSEGRSRKRSEVLDTRTSTL